MARPKQETLTLFPEIVSITRKFSDAQFGALMRAAFAYRFDGEIYSGDDPAIDVAFQTVAGQIDRYIEVCKGNSQNAKGREREQSKAECSETKQNPPPIHSSSYPNPIPKDVAGKPPTRKRFVSPTVQDIARARGTPWMLSDSWITIPLTVGGLGRIICETGKPLSELGQQRKS